MKELDFLEDSNILLRGNLRHRINTASWMKSLKLKSESKWLRLR